MDLHNSGLRFGNRRRFHGAVEIMYAHAAMTRRAVPYCFLRAFKRRTTRGSILYVIPTSLPATRLSGSLIGSRSRDRTSAATSNA